MTRHEDVVAPEPEQLPERDDWLATCPRCSQVVIAETAAAALDAWKDHDMGTPGRGHVATQISIICRTSRGRSPGRFPEDAQHGRGRRAACQHVLGAQGRERSRLDR